MAKENDDTILARWLAGKLTEEERKIFESESDFKLLEKIAVSTDRWSVPELNEEYYSRLQQKMASKKEAKIKPLYQYKWAMRLAASLLLIVGLFGLYQIFFAPEIISYQCAAGQKLDIYLPDKTFVKLNGYSSISFDNKNWSKNRKVTLNGEAYFEVYQKGAFTVLFNQGELNVLGTKFNVLSGNALAIVKCYEGKVSVSDKKEQKEILTEGEAVKVYTDSTSSTYKIAEKNPDWMNGESVFTDAPLIEVINALSVQFNVQFDIHNEKELTRKYTGKFIHTNLETALSMVFPPMSISYTVEGEKRKMVILK